MKTNKEDLTCIAWYMQNWTLDANLIWTDIKNEISDFWKIYSKTVVQLGCIYGSYWNNDKEDDHARTKPGD